MSDNLEGAPFEGAPEAVPAIDAASEATENTEGLPPEAPAEAELEAKAKAEAEEAERRTRNDRRREAKEILQRKAQEAQERAQEAERQAKALQDAMKSRPLPKPEAFASFEEYQAELAARRTLGVLRSEQADELLRTAQAERQRIEEVRRAEAQEDARVWATQAQEARSRYPDFDKVAMQDAPITKPLADVIVQSDLAADVAYWLGKNPDECQRIAALPPMQMARAVGNIEARLSAPKPPPVTAAPDPIAPVKGRATPAKDPATMSAAEYRAWREAGGRPTP